MSKLPDGFKADQFWGVSFMIDRLSDGSVVICKELVNDIVAGKCTLQEIQRHLTSAPGVIATQSDVIVEYK